MQIDERIDRATSVLLLEKIWRFALQDAEREVDAGHHYFERYDSIRQKRLTILQEVSHGTLFEIAETMLSKASVNAPMC